MTEQNTANPSAQPQEKKKSGCLMKFFKLVLCLLLVIVVLWCVWFLLSDREMKPVPVADVYDEVNYAKGEVPDYRTLYNSLQEKDVFPAEENGWIDVFQKLGPKAIEQSSVAERTKWENFIANKEPTSVYQKHWKPLCEKLGLDPKEKPLFYDRLELESYLVKNGVRGDETASEKSEEDDGADLEDEDEDGFLHFPRTVVSYSYWENAEERRGKISHTAAMVEYLRITTAPWTPEEHPIAAQWLDENKDRLELVAQAARKPKFHCWHFVPEPERGSFWEIIAALDAQYARELARWFKMRANMRVGTGDLSGAIDDMETIFAFARHLIDDESYYLLDRLVGIACVNVAASIPLYANPTARPTVDDRARAMALLRDNFENELTASRLEKMWRASMIFDFGEQADIIRKVGQGDLELFRDMCYLDLPSISFGGFDVEFDEILGSPFGKFISAVTPVNEPKIHQLFRQHYLELAQASTEKLGALDEELGELLRRKAWPRGGLSETAALIMLSSTFPASNAAKVAYQRTDCSFRLATLAHAIWAYYDANGTLPPAFSVDANGAPLHSWRVLILPYLGEQEKALYEQIRLDEPWNSEHNKAFYDQMPDVYRCLSYKDLPQGETIYSVLTANDGIFDRSGTGKDPNAIFQRENRESADQIMLVERANPICWMTPDAELDADQALEEERLDYSDFFGLKVHAGGCNAATFGGQAIFFSEMRSTSINALRHDLFGEPTPERENETEEEYFLQDEM